MKKLENAYEKIVESGNQLFELCHNVRLLILPSSHPKNPRLGLRDVRTHEYGKTLQSECGRRVES